MKKQKKKMSGGMKAVIVILLVVAVGLLGFSAYKLIGIGETYKEANDLYADIAAIVSAPTAEAVETETKKGMEPKQETSEPEVQSETETEQVATEELAETEPEPTTAEEPTKKVISIAESVTVPNSEPKKSAEETVSETVTETEDVTVSEAEPEQDPVEDTVSEIATETEDPLLSEAESEQSSVEEAVADTIPAPENEPVSDAEPEQRPEESAEPEIETPVTAAAESETTEEIKEPESGETDLDTQQIEISEEQKKVVTALHHFRYASMNWNFNTLLSLCEDSVGWIYNEDTPISYPVVQGEDNNQYLRHMINGEYNVAGTLFVDSRFEQGLDSHYSTIYGHNMDDKSMFGSITSYKNEDYYKEHPEMELYIGDRMYAYEVYAAFQVHINSIVFSYFDEIPKTEAEKVSKEADYDKLLKEIKENRLYITDAKEIDKDSYLVALITCIDYPRDYNYRFVVILERKEVLLHPSWKESIEPENEVEKEPK